MTTLLDARGIAISPRDSESLDRFEEALASFQARRADALSRVDAILARDPGFIAAHCLRAASLMLSGSLAGDPALAQAIRTIECAGQGANDRERRHAAAARAWFDGDPRLALERYGELVVDYPRDSLALQVAHALDFRLGLRDMLRDRVAAVLPYWDAHLTGFGYVLGMYAFGLEECGDYARAEATARRSLELEPRNASATHAIAHVMEMQGRTREGIAWLESTRGIWATNVGFAVHNAWHLALFHVDLDARTTALAIYDQMLVPTPSSSTAALVDASALLWRLQLHGMELRNRWRYLAQCWERKPLVGERAFNVVHAVMAFTAADRAGLARRATALLRDDVATRLANTAEDLDLAVPLCEALQAFGRGDFVRAVDKIAVVRSVADRCGGSIAQCDLIHLTLIEAALRSQRARLARTLAAERTARKPDSLLNRSLFARAGAVASTLG